MATRPSCMYSSKLCHFIVFVKKHLIACVCVWQVKGFRGCGMGAPPETWACLSSVWLPCTVPTELGGDSWHEKKAATVLREDTIVVTHSPFSWYVLVVYTHYDTSSPQPYHHVAELTYITIHAIAVTVCSVDMTYSLSLPWAYACAFMIRSMLPDLQ